MAWCNKSVGPRVQRLLHLDWQNAATAITYIALEMLGLNFHETLSQLDRKYCNIELNKICVAVANFKNFAGSSSSYWRGWLRSSSSRGSFRCNTRRNINFHTSVLSRLFLYYIYIFFCLSFWTFQKVPDAYFIFCRKYKLTFERFEQKGCSAAHRE